MSPGERAIYAAAWAAMYRASMAAELGPPASARRAAASAADAVESFRELEKDLPELDPEGVAFYREMRYGS